MVGKVKRVFVSFVLRVYKFINIDYFAKCSVYDKCVVN